MAFNTVLNTEHWYQWTYGVLFSNWNWGSQTMVLLDNGEIWACMVNFPMASQGEQSYAAWLGTVSPDGSERKMGDLWARGPTGTDYGLKTTDTYAPHSNLFAAWDGTDLFTDGTTVYILGQQQTGGAGATLGARIWSLNPDTLELEHVALDGSTPADNDPYEDNHDAKLASSIQPRKPVYWNEAFYFWDNVDLGTKENLITLRRWKPGEGVSTVTPSLNSPTGYATMNTGLVNPDTGLLNALNDDLVETWSSTAYMGSAIHNDWLYFVHDAGGYADGGLKAVALRRLDLNNPDNGVETLFYSLDEQDAVDAITYRDWDSDFASTPTGTPHPYDNPTYRNAVLPGLGTPELLGFHTSFGSACVLGDDFICENTTLASFFTGYQETGEQLVAFSIPDLLAAIENNDGKPLRHDRTNPIFRTIANAAVGDHGYIDHNYKNRWAIWMMIDGGVPAFNHINPGSLITNPNAEGWGNKILYLANSVDDTMCWAENTTGWQGHFVKVLEPKGATDRDFAVTFSFEGRVLKGYGPAVGIEQAYAPEEVILQ